MAAGNLKPAPLPLTGDLVAKLVGDRPAYGRGIRHVPVVSNPVVCSTCKQERHRPCDLSTCPIGRQAASAAEPAWCDDCGLPDDCCCPEGGES